MRFLFHISFAFICFTSCASNIAGVSIPARQEFVLGELANKNYRAELNNRGKQQIRIAVLDKDSKEQTQGFGLAAGGKATVYISRPEEVHLMNESDTEGKVRVKLNKGVEGMRYQDIKTNGQK
jgi:hypothetical protein